LARTGVVQFSSLLWACRLMRTRPNFPIFAGGHNKPCSRPASALAVILLATVPTWAKPNIANLAHRCDSLGQQKACGELARLAEYDKDPTVRIDAIGSLKDQTLLTKLALGDKVKSVRQAAIQRLTDQAVLGQIAMRDPDFFIRLSAVENLSDQVLLAKIVAAETDTPGLRWQAIGKVTDQTLLKKVALEDKDADARIIAVGRLTDQSLLAELARGNSDTGLRLAAIAALSDQAFLTELAGDMDRYTANPLEAQARIRLALLDPIVVARLPHARLATEYRSTSGKYYSTAHEFPFPKSQDYSVTGEGITFAITQGERTLAKSGESTFFPHQVPLSTEFIPVRVELLTFFRQFFSQPEFTEGDLLKMTQSRIPEVRVGARANSRDEATLAELVLGLTGWLTNGFIVDKLTDQRLLARISVEHPDSYVRNAAVEKLLDQTLLARILLEDPDRSVRESARSRLAVLRRAEH